jgi:hypothetical protein
MRLPVFGRIVPRPCATPPRGSNSAHLVALSHLRLNFFSSSLLGKESKVTHPPHVIHFRNGNMTPYLRPLGSCNTAHCALSNLSSNFFSSTSVRVQKEASNNLSHVTSPRPMIGKVTLNPLLNPLSTLLKREENIVRVIEPLRAQLMLKRPLRAQLTRKCTAVVGLRSQPPASQKRRVTKDLNTRRISLCLSSMVGRTELTNRNQLQ